MGKIDASAQDTTNGYIYLIFFGGLLRATFHPLADEAWDHGALYC